jgi:hypothetical protein
MLFGIWPGVVAADPATFQPLDCPPEDPAQTLTALRTLQGGARPFFVRAYRHFGTGVAPHAGLVASPVRPEVYAGEGRLIDLVACYQSPRADPEGFADFVRQAVRDVVAWGGGKVQVGEELNAPAPQDGGSPGCFEAVAAGVAAALDERDRFDLNVDVGVNSAGMADPGFWRTLTASLGPELTQRLDYIGLDAFPDVFAPIPHDRLPEAVGALLDRFRDVTAEAGVPGSTPIHLTETGWPTGEQRGEHTQASVLAAVADAVCRSNVGVTTYEWFGLRDGLSTAPWYARFGILRDDYSLKPAFTALQDLITTHTNGTA